MIVQPIWGSFELNLTTIEGGSGGYRRAKSLKGGPGGYGTRMQVGPKLFSKSLAPSRRRRVNVKTQKYRNGFGKLFLGDAIFLDIVEENGPFSDIPPKVLGFM